ncbi:hypothetical protein A9Q84_14150 [Halobacteriovorax marinus]|uniref:Type II/III secretion system secretin-like domain-containing protein n=1 Tax=Halobacteriovorax marinus TaxID=97084 RepID=A0A1Y5F4R4_9BACT|nr:hypothetical protein A9Q84_14150 [Halobacteriovorax marinus]
MKSLKRRSYLSTLLVLLLLLGSCSTFTGSSKIEIHPTVSKNVVEMLENISVNTDVKASVKQGIQYIAENNYKDASKSFGEALRLDPINGHLHFLNGLSYHLMSLNGDSTKLELAESGYKLAIRYDASNHWAALYLGNIYFSKRRYLDAQNQFSYGLLYAPENQELLKALSVASYYAKNIELSSWAAEKALNDKPKDLSNLRNSLFTRAAGGEKRDENKSLIEYKKLIESKKNKQPIENLAYKSLLNRVNQWDRFHYGAKTAQNGEASVFGSSSRAEGTPLNLDDSAKSTKSVNKYNSYLSSSKKKKKRKGRRKKKLNLPKMTLVDVVIIRTEESRTENKGINILSGLQATLTGTMFGYNSAATAGTKDTTIAPTLTLAGLKYNFNIFNDGSNKAEILARPSLLAVEGETSDFSSGATLHVQLSSSNVDGSMVDVPVGINLNVTPTFYDDETVKIDVSAKRTFLENNSEKVGFTAFTQTSLTSVKATAVLRFGETLILSGLSENENESSEDGVPFLQNIPIIQYLFSNKQKLKTKKNVLILLTPHKARYADRNMGSSQLRNKLLKKDEKNKFVFELQAKENIARNNIDAALLNLESNLYFREFRSGDLHLDDWHNDSTFTGALLRSMSFLYY